MTPQSQLTLTEFLEDPQYGDRHEFINGEAVQKMSPKFFHASLQTQLLLLLYSWGQKRGVVATEWAVALKRDGRDWAPIPDLLYISNDRLPSSDIEDIPCPVPPDLAIEIISPGQTFGELSEKATDYLAAGVLRVWVVDTRSQIITVFFPDSPPQTYKGDRTLSDSIFPELKITPRRLFQQAGIPEK
ncbi:Uma2 family endonuclease [Lyngbya sp. CCY1209]|jgi:Uma2 family endonuclease|uniref:Uma2 family endonuclease n=1 Tax=Lyngbya sp. CCY1209 TaxID=2886103 RepID=UPI002D2040D6|nr:Uma2 family endonuclease [Lyngbya sp. CCY1209]MEB3882011.1 Uma2 family endonuclease [Lyngbya sp. CCY1209]